MKIETGVIRFYLDPPTSNHPSLIPDCHPKALHQWHSFVRKSIGSGIMYCLEQIFAMFVTPTS